MPIIKSILLFCGGLFLSQASLAENITVPHGVATIDWRSDFSLEEKNFLRQWLNKATHTASQLAGKFPREKSRIVIERAGGRRLTSRWPVPWGQTLRRGLDGVLFQVNLEKTMNDYVGDWTAPHEFSHLFIPYPGQADIWLSEGFASYYQNILMAREGIYSPQTAWQKLYEGFVRAEGDRNSNHTLREVSRERRRYRATMRIYWSGALYFLEADIAIRQATNNTRSLDWVLDQYINCCRHQQERWTGEQMVESFDEIVGDIDGLDKVFSKLYERYTTSMRIPDARPLLSQLGINIENEKVVFSNEPTLAAFRHDFTRARLSPMPQP